MVVMIATSAPPSWHAEDSATMKVTSQGQGDDQRIRMTFKVGGKLARQTDSLMFDVTAIADRPASDLRATWLTQDDGSSDSADLGTAAQASIDETFTQLFFYGDPPLGNCGGSDCTFVREVRFSTETEQPYVLDITVSVNASGDGDKTPKGDLTVELELLDAP